MAGESQQLPDSAPDPSTLTTEQLLRAAQAERDYVDGKIAVLEERLGAIDRATRLLNETVNRVPTETQVVVGSMRELIDEKFNSVALQFAERDTRQERESRDNKTAVDAAFAASKEAAAKQDESNLKAIDKTERAMNETIMKLSELVNSKFAAIEDKVDALTRRLDKLV